jgi:hypothetical protein
MQLNFGVIAQHKEVPISANITWINNVKVIALIAQTLSFLYPICMKFYDNL